MKARLLATIVVVVLAMALMQLAATSQGMPPLPATPVPGEAPTGALAEFDIDELPTPHAEVWFLRMELEPRGSLHASVQAGPSMVYVESGRLALIADGPVSTNAGRATPVGNDAEQTILAAGTSAMVEAGTMVSFWNDGGGPVTFLVLLMYSAEDEGADQTEYPDPVGLKQGGVAIGTAEFMPIPASVTIERVVVEPGTTVEPEMNASEMEMPGYVGMELGAVETGSADVELEYAGMGNIFWPEMLENQMGGPELAPLTATVQLATGDAYAFHGSTLTWTVTSDDPLTVLRVVIMPELPME